MYKKVYIEITNNCNLSCDFCPHNKRKNEFITLDNFNLILDKLENYTKYLCEDGIHPNEKGHKIIAVGTTSVRTLESVATKFGGTLKADIGETNIFIYPGYQWKIVDHLITNFHLPESTLIMLVSSFCGIDNTLKFYKEAVEQKYRFFSFGDACLLL